MAQTKFDVSSPEEFRLVAQDDRFILNSSNKNGGDRVIEVEKRESRGRKSLRSSSNYEDFGSALQRDSERFYKDLDLGVIKDKKSFDVEFDRMLNDSSVWSFRKSNNPNFSDDAKKSYRNNKDLIKSGISFRFYSFKEKATGKFISKERAESLGNDRIIKVENFKELKSGRILKRDTGKTRYANVVNRGRVQSLNV